jgi:5-methyltetrahydrofolate--homocysteine methyltransferase
MNRQTFRELLGQRVLVCDAPWDAAPVPSPVASAHESAAGADPSATPARGPREMLALLDYTELVERHRASLAAGADILLTNTFAANRPALALFDLQAKLPEIVRRSVEAAREAIVDAPRHTDDLPAVGFVLGPLAAGVGAGTSLEAAIETYREVAKIAKAQSPDLFVLESIHDLVNLRAILIALRMVAPDIPVVAQMAFGPNGRTVEGSSPAIVWAVARALGADAVGASGRLAPAEMLPVASAMQAVSDLAIAFQPTAMAQAAVPRASASIAVDKRPLRESAMDEPAAEGDAIEAPEGATPESAPSEAVTPATEALETAGTGAADSETAGSETAASEIAIPEAAEPEPVARELLHPQEFARQMKLLLGRGAAIVGCSGAHTPAHLEALVRVAAGQVPQSPAATPGVFLASRTRDIEIGARRGLVAVAEWPELWGEARQIFTGTGVKDLVRAVRAHMQADVQVVEVRCTLPPEDEPRFFEALLPALQAQITLPLLINAETRKGLETALRHVWGRCLVAGVWGDAKTQARVFPLAREHGAAVVAACHAGSEIPFSAEERLKIAEQILEAAIAAGLPPEDLIFDPVAMPARTDAPRLIEALRAIALIKTELGQATLLRVSRVSDGLPGRGRVEAAFLAMAAAAGLDIAVIDAGKARLMDAVAAATLLAGRDRDARHYLARFSEDSGERRAAAGVLMGAPAGTPVGALAGTPASTPETGRRPERFVKDTRRDGERSDRRESHPRRPSERTPQREPQRAAYQRPDRASYQRPERSASREPDRSPYHKPERGGHRPPERGGYRPSERGAYRPPERDGNRAPERGGYRPPERGAYRPSERDGNRPPERGGYRPPERSTYSRPERAPYQPPQRGGYRPPERAGYPRPERTPYPRPERGGYHQPERGAYRQPESGSDEGGSSERGRPVRPDRDRPPRREAGPPRDRARAGASRERTGGSRERAGASRERRSPSAPRAGDRDRHSRPKKSGRSSAPPSRPSPRGARPAGRPPKARPRSSSAPKRDASR